MSWYTEQLKDPRWQKKRLEVFSRDNWQCVKCGDKTTELQVDHKAYNGAPWEAPLKDLQTLCRNCHEIKSGITRAKMREPFSVHKAYRPGNVKLSRPKYKSAEEWKKLIKRSY